MTLLIAFMLIADQGLDSDWYFIAAFVWAAEIFIRHVFEPKNQK